MTANVNFFDAPCGGNRQAGQTWASWRSAVFNNNTYCNPAHQNYDEAKCNQHSGYFSKFINGVWLGQMQPVSVKQIYSKANPCMCTGMGSTCGSADDYAYTKTWCESLLYPNGKSVPAEKRPFACGGNGPNVYQYDPMAVAMENTQDEVERIFRTSAEEDKSGIIILVAIIVFIVIIIASMLWGA